MTLETASLNGFQELQERLEQDKSLNIQITATIAGIWFVFASIVAMLSGAGGSIGSEGGGASSSAHGTTLHAVNQRRDPSSSSSSMSAEPPRTVYTACGVPSGTSM